ncbi:MAG: ATP-dependent helicase [Nanoarchaeota archaeon]|nr:ATP-dependent helicase [Nanoarchaeota archaeon]
MIKMSINPEKQSIIALDGNVLVTANPGTGKTRLLAYKYIDLINKGIRPEQILCLTFTHKAKKEMENRILELIKKNKIDVDISKLNVYTFHSYALDNLDEKEVISSNLLRFSIFKYLKDNEILNYEDAYLLDTIVPKMENLIRYLKSFGVMPDSIDINEAKQHLEGDKKYSKEEIDKFADDFLAIFQHYEDIKNRKGVDYADLLIRFLQLREIPQFEYVLVDELQDVNVLEADIALKSCKNFIAVGDKKQAIFGFQGGSILNFKKFEDSHQAILSENFRNTNEILTYAREYFISRTKEEAHKEDLKGLRNANDATGPIPVIYDVDKNAYAIACELAKNLEGETAIITRTNYQIMDISRELKARGLEFSSTFFSASGDAKLHIINFLKGIISLDIQEVKNSMFTPFFPCSLQNAFTIADDRYITMEQMMEKLPDFKKLRESITTVEDINILFKERIVPICISYGKEYLSAAATVQEAFNEALSVLGTKDTHSLMSYLTASDLLSQDSDVDKKIIVTTVHKAKGREFENVIYLPSKTNDRSNFQDRIVEAILTTKGISAEEELEEETLRVNFVAFTRAEKKLIILTEKVQDYLNEFSELKELDAEVHVGIDLDESKKRAYDLFVDGQMDEAKKLLENKERWLKDFVKNHFASLDHTSFSSLPKDAYSYFMEKMLNINTFTAATTLGSDVHAAAEELCKGNDVTPTDETKPYIDNTRALIEEIKQTYPIVEEPEKKLKEPLNRLGFDSELIFKGFIDAIFKNDAGEYLIVDWKTSKNDNYGGEHRQQLSVYKKAFAAREGIPEDKIQVAIGYVGLRSTINMGRTERRLDMAQPRASAFGTVSKRIEKLLSWINDPEVFFADFMDKPVDELLWRSVAEEAKKEGGKNG